MDETDETELKEQIEKDIRKGPDPNVIIEESWRRILRETENSILMAEINTKINQKIIKLASKELDKLEHRKIEVVNVAVE